MEQQSGKGMSGIEMARAWRKWKWFLLFAGAIILAATLAFVLHRSRIDSALGIMMPRQIGFSSNDKGSFNLYSKSLGKNDYEKIAVFFLNRDLFSRYLSKNRGQNMADPGKSFDLRSIVLPNFTVDFSEAAVRNETLQYLLLRSAPARGLTLDLVGNFVLNVFKNYYLLEIFYKYYNSLQEANADYLDSQRQILDGMDKVSAKIAQLRQWEKKYPAGLTGRGNFMLQVSGDNERYLDLRQQLAANDILFGDNRLALELNQKKIARSQFMIAFVSDLRREYLEVLFQDPGLARNRVLAVQRGSADKDLVQEFQKIRAFFDLVDYNFRLLPADPMMLKDRYLFLKAMAIFIFALGLLLLAILALEHRRNWRA